MAVSKKAERQELKKPTQQQELNVAGNPSNRALTNAAEEDDVTPVPVFTGAQDNTDEDLIKFHASRIANGWHKSVGTILEVSKNCADADVKIPGHLKERFYKALLIDRTVFCKLAAIGRSQSLHNPDVLTSLPAHYSILYEARLLSPPELDRAIADKVVVRMQTVRKSRDGLRIRLTANSRRQLNGINAGSLMQQRQGKQPKLRHSRRFGTLHRSWCISGVGPSPPFEMRLSGRSRRTGRRQFEADAQVAFVAWNPLAVLRRLARPIEASFLRKTAAWMHLCIVNRNQLFLREITISSVLYFGKHTGKRLVVTSLHRSRVV